MSNKKEFTLVINGIETIYKDFTALNEVLAVTTRHFSGVVTAAGAINGALDQSDAKLQKMTEELGKLHPLLKWIADVEKLIRPEETADAAVNATNKIEKAVTGTAQVAEKTTATVKSSAERMKDEMEAFKKEFDYYLKVGTDTYTMYLNMRKEENAEALKEVTQQHAKATEAQKKSTEQIIALQEKAKNARGGRSLALQEQINSEMANNKKLADQEAALAKNKEKLEKEKAKLERREKKQKLAGGIIESYANIAVGVVKAMALGPIVGPPLAILVAAAGAIQIGIQAHQLSKLADGGLLKGKRHTGGGMRIEGSNIEVEGGEYVVNRQSTDRNLGLIRYINSNRKELTQQDLNSFFSKTSKGYQSPFRSQFEEGGQLPIFGNTPTVDNDMLVDAIRNIRIEPRVAVTDISHAQQSMVSVDTWAGI